MGKGVMVQSRCGVGSAMPPTELHWLPCKSSVLYSMFSTTDADPSDSLLCGGDMSDEGAEGRAQTHSWLEKEKPVKFQVGAFAYS